MWGRSGAASEQRPAEQASDHVATRELGRDAALSAVDDLRRWTSRGRVVMPGITEGHLGAAQSVRVRYRALDLDLADAVNVALAADFDKDAILTLDRRDFRAVRPLVRYKAFRVLPDDLPL
ncbi:VapC toxin family PIN domain ribonuclease [Streptomyces paradoxus]|uniref:VapC toxin family PIN domain ribonuclease n=1 Tax=Streptomyces paradoxus TaxID=66375 RepID=UPI0037CDCC6E